jgi:uncharacterized protein (DUF305 family)
LTALLLLLATATAVLAVRAHVLAESTPSRYTSGISLYRMDTASAERVLHAIDSLQAFGMLMPDAITVVTPSAAECDQLRSADTVAETTLDRSFVSNMLTHHDVASVVQMCDNWSDVVLVHELTHVWDNGRLTDTQRAVIQQFLNMPTWNDQSMDWADRASEMLAEGVMECVLGFYPPDGEFCPSLQDTLASVSTPSNPVFIMPQPGWDDQVSLQRIDRIGK